jgi:hypothetical protein
VTTPDLDRYNIVVRNARRLDLPEADNLTGGAAQGQEHVRVYTATELAEALREAGFVDIEIEPVDAFYNTDGSASDDKALHLARARKPDFAMAEQQRLHVLAPGWVPLGPHAHERGFAGGSEQAVAHLAPRLGRHGWQVHLWASPLEDGREWVSRDVSWHRFEAFGAPGQLAPRRGDAVLVWRRADIIPEVSRDFPAVPVLGWFHDIASERHLPGYLAADRLLVLSRYHAGLFEALGVPAEKIVQVQNGIDLGAIARAESAPRKLGPHAVIYPSSADRGLLALLAAWPAVRGAVRGRAEVSHRDGSPGSGQRWA